MITLTNIASLKKGPHRVQPEIYFEIEQIREALIYDGGYGEIVALLDGHNVHHSTGYEVDIRLEKPVDRAELLKCLGPHYEVTIEEEPSEIVHVRFP